MPYYASMNRPTSCTSTKASTPSGVPDEEVVLPACKVAYPLACVHPGNLQVRLVDDVQFQLALTVGVVAQSGSMSRKPSGAT